MSVRLYCRAWQVCWVETNICLMNVGFIHHICNIVFQMKCAHFSLFIFIFIYDVIFIHNRFNHLSLTVCVWHRQLSFFVFTFRTLSNWVYELDKWAPSVVKIAYKVKPFFLLLFFSLHILPKRALTDGQFGWLMSENCPFSVFVTEGNSCVAAGVCASTPQREVQCLADNLWIHHQGQADTGQGKRD